MLCSEMNSAAHASLLDLMRQHTRQQRASPPLLMVLAADLADLDLLLPQKHGEHDGGMSPKVSYTWRMKRNSSEGDSPDANGSHHGGGSMHGGGSRHGSVHGGVNGSMRSGKPPLSSNRGGPRHEILSQWRFSGRLSWKLILTLPTTFRVPVQIDLPP